MLEAVEPLLFTETPKELCGHQTFILEQTENQRVPIILNSDLIISWKRTCHLTCI